MENLLWELDLCPRMTSIYHAKGKIIINNSKKTKFHQNMTGIKSG